MRRNASIALVSLACCLMVVAAVLAQSSSGYDLERQVVAGAGESMASSHYAMDSVLGQPVASGATQSANFRLRAGYWSTTAGLAGRYQIYLPLVVRDGSQGEHRHSLPR